MIRTHRIHVRRSREREKIDLLFSQEEMTNKQVIEEYTETIVNCYLTIQDLYQTTLTALKKENLKELKSANRIVTQLNSDTKDLKINLHQTLSRLNEGSFESGSYYVQIVDDIRDLVHAITFIVRPGLDHVDNNHQGLTNPQSEDLNDIKSSLFRYFELSRELIGSRKGYDLTTVIDLQNEILGKLEGAKKQQIRRIKKAESGTKNSILYLAILQETKNLTLITFSLLKSHREFIRAINR